MIPKFRADEELDSGTYDLDKYDVMEYLDESDKNGIDVCVGDIVKYHPSGYTERNIEYDQYLQVVRVGSRFVQTNDNSTPDLWYDWDELVVVGNVYDNVELLEAGE
jgi:uncharacterized phage protein (TIGR01671 family)